MELTQIFRYADGAARSSISYGTLQNFWVLFLL